MKASFKTRLERLEADSRNFGPTGHNVHTIHTIINPDKSVYEVLETIIENGVVIRDDCGRPLGQQR